MDWQTNRPHMLSEDTFISRIGILCGKRAWAVGDDNIC